MCPTLGKGKSSSKSALIGDMLVPGRVDVPQGAQGFCQKIHSWNSDQPCLNGWK